MLGGITMQVNRTGFMAQDKGTSRGALVVRGLLGLRGAGGAPGLG